MYKCPSELLFHEKYLGDLHIWNLPKNQRASKTLRISPVNQQWTSWDHYMVYLFFIDKIWIDSPSKCFFPISLESENQRVTDEWWRQAPSQQQEMTVKAKQKTWKIKKWKCKNKDFLNKLHEMKLHTWKWITWNEKWDPEDGVEDKAHSPVLCKKWIAFASRLYSKRGPRKELGQCGPRQGDIKNS